MLLQLQYLDKDDLASAYTDAQMAARRQWLKYDEYERLAMNEVRTDLPANMPRVNDGSLSAALRKVPKRIMAQNMTGKIKAVDRDENWVALLANIILEDHIIPNANTDAPFLSKWQTAIKNSLIYGSQPIYTFFTQHGTYTGADMSLPYVRNVYLEPGKISDMSSDFIFMDSWYTKLQLKRLLDKAIEDMKEAVEGGFEDEVIWDPKALQAIYDAGPSGKDSLNMTAKERTGENRNEKGLYRLTTCFNRGYKAPFYTFSPNNANQVAGVQFNTNPTGDLPIIYLYADEDLINPYGTGMIQTAGATQNVLDNLTQTDVLSTQIGAQPPIDIHGDRSTTRLSSLEYAPRAYWFTGNATVTPVVHQNPNFYGQLPNRIALYKSQLQYQTGTIDNTIPAQEGATGGMSKTPQGVQAAQNIMNADDNFIQQRVGEAYQRTIRSMVNIHMNNMEGTQLLQCEGDDIELLATTDLVPVDENGNPATDQIEVVWDNVRATFDFLVDPDSGVKTNDMQQAQNIQQAISEISLPVSYYMAQNGYKFNIGEAYHSLFDKLGIDNIDKVITKMTPEEKQEAQSAPFPIIDPPQLRYALRDLPPEAVPAALQNAGISFDSSHMSMPWADQAAMMSAQAKSQPAMGQASNDPSQPPQQQGQTQQTDQQGNPLPQQNGQQATAQMSAPTPSTDPGQDSPYYTQMQDPSQQQGPPLQPNIQQRVMQIQEQYNVDADTAMTVAAAQDHGLTDEQLPQLFQLLAQEDQAKESQVNNGQA